MPARTAGSQNSPKAARQTCAEDPDRDGDGTPDRCDACPLQPGMLWDDWPSIDGCATDAFHSLVREPQGVILRVAFKHASHEPPSLADLEELTRALKDAHADSIALVGYASPSERAPKTLPQERARRMAEALVARSVSAKLITYASLAEAQAVDVAILSRNGTEELRWVGDRFEHVRAAAFREARKRAEGQPSPCGRVPGNRTLPPVPACP